jgi:uncharacterized membrane protein
MTREIVGILLIIFGVLCTFAGKVGVRNSDGGIVFWFGPALIAFGTAPLSVVPGAANKSDMTLGSVNIAADA